MIIPIRCFTCGKVIAHIQNDDEGEEGSEQQPPPQPQPPPQLRRYCCKRMLLTHVPIINKLLKYTEK